MDSGEPTNATDELTTPSLVQNQAPPTSNLVESSIHATRIIANGSVRDGSVQNGSSNVCDGSLSTVTEVGTPIVIPSEQPVLSLGAWSKPLNPISDQSPVTLLMQTTKNLLADLSSETQWPSLSTASRSNQRRQSVAASPKANAAPVAPLGCFQDSLDQKTEYPWAAKMDKTKRNLHQVTSPVFLEDGTPKVRIPRQVLLEGLENQKEFVLGQFYRCSAPPSGLVQSVVSRIWGTKCRIYTRQLGASSFLFHIPDEPTRKWVTQRGIWHVDDCILFVSDWNPAGTLALPEIKTIPVWLTLKNIPHQLYSKKGISWIASGIDAPMLTSRPWLDPILMGEAKILVEVKLDRPFPQRVAIEDEDGSLTMVTVIYSWLPSKCLKCGQLGHKAARCLGLPPVPVFKDPHNAESPKNHPSHAPHVENSEEVHAVPNPLNEAQKSADIISFDSQGCILLDQERNDLGPFDMPTEVVNNSEVIAPVSPRRSASLEMETETIPQFTSIEDLSKTLTSPTHEADSLPPFTAISTTTTSLSPTISTPLNLTDAGSLTLPSIGDLNSESIKKLGEASSSNRFNGLAMMDEEKEMDVVSSPSHALAQTIDNNSPFVFNSSLSSPPAEFLNPLGMNAQVSSDEIGFNMARASSSSSSDMAQRSRGGCCLKPSQKLKDMEWFTVGCKGRRGRGNAAHGRSPR